MKRNLERLHPHPDCLLCGDNNPNGLHLGFVAIGNGEVKAAFKGNHLLQGYEGVLHGGVIASLLDSAMTNCLFFQGVSAVTGELNVRYRLPIPCCAELELRAWLVVEKRPLFELRAEVLMGERIMARATARLWKKQR